jgi:hypothetical protein
MEMRQRYEKEQQELKKKKLDIIGEQFILNSQINTITDQTARLNDQERDFKDTIKKQIFDTDKKAKEVHKQKSQLEHEVRTYEGQMQKESSEHFENTMTLEKTKVF